VSNILLNGTTGEFFSLTRDEQKRLLKIARKNFSGTIIFHAGCDSLAESIELARFAEQSGADAISSLPPYYLSNASEQGIIDYFNCIAGSLSVPFILYNFPKHTQHTITPHILSSVMHYGLKDSSAMIPLARSTEHYFVGSDKNILKAYKAGGRGFISARANYFPELYVFLEKILREQNFSKAKSVQKEIHALAERYSGPNQIAMIKHALAKRLRGYPIEVRLPLVPLSQEEIDKLSHK
ncbi:MAG: dihydrodipicolinate synthase family protein, partial [bacterium]|nr:dihydrodipicolinate synthase family protein [bacterium]